MNNVLRPNFESKYVYELGAIRAFTDTLERKLARVGCDLEVGSHEFWEGGVALGFTSNGAEMSLGYVAEDGSWCLDAPGIGVLSFATLEGLADTVFHLTYPAAPAEFPPEEDDISNDDGGF